MRIFRKCAGVSSLLLVAGCLAAAANPPDETVDAQTSSTGSGLSRKRPTGQIEGLFDFPGIVVSQKIRVRHTLSDTTREAFVDRDGRFAFSGLEAGAWDVESLVRSNQLEGFCGVGSPRVEVKAGEVTNVVLKPASGVIEGGIVSPDGKPVADADVVAMPSRPSSPWPFHDRTMRRHDGPCSRRAVSDSEGRFRLGGLVPGDYVVTAGKEHWMPGSLSTSTADALFAIHLGPRKKRITGRLLDDAGNDVAGGVSCTPECAVVAGRFTAWVAPNETRLAFHAPRVSSDTVVRFVATELELPQDGDHDMGDVKIQRIGDVHARFPPGVDPSTCAGTRDPRKRKDGGVWTFKPAGRGPLRIMLACGVEVIDQTLEVGPDDIHVDLAFSRKGGTIVVKFPNAQRGHVVLYKNGHDFGLKSEIVNGEVVVRNIPPGRYDAYSSTSWTVKDIDVGEDSVFTFTPNAKELKESKTFDDGPERNRGL